MLLILNLQKIPCTIHTTVRVVCINCRVRAGCIDLDANPGHVDLTIGSGRSSLCVRDRRIDLYDRTGCTARDCYKHYGH